MVEASIYLIILFILNFQNIQSSTHIKKTSSNGVNNDLLINTTSGLFQGKTIIISSVSVRQYFGIPYGEKPIRFELPILRKYDNRTIVQAVKPSAACPQIAGGLSYGPFNLPDMFDEDCLTLNMFIPKTKSSMPKAIMVFCHGGSNQAGSGSLFDGSAIAAIGDVIVITINYRLNLFGFLTPGTDILSGNYGLQDQLLALTWISMNAKYFQGDPKRITYVGHSTGAANAMLLAMSKRSDGLIARVIAQSGGPLNHWTLDPNPKIRFDNVMKENNMKTKKSSIMPNIDQLKRLPATDFHYLNDSGLEIVPKYPFPTIDNDLLTDNIEHMIRTRPFVNIDILIGTTADESLYFAQEHIFNYYLPKNYHTNSYLSFISQSETMNMSQTDSAKSNIEKSNEHKRTQGLSFFKNNEPIKAHLKANYPNHLCYFDEIEGRYMPKAKHHNTVNEVARHYINLVSDLMFYYDLVRFLHERLHSESLASTYVYYYSYPPTFDFGNGVGRAANTVGHFAEIDLVWGVPFFEISNQTYLGMHLNKRDSYTTEEIQFSYQMIRYWTNFVKTGNPNEPDNASIYWPPYEKTKKSYINLHARRTRIENDFLEDRFQFWNMISHRPKCNPLHWYQICLLVGILIFALLLIIIYIFHNAKRSRRNIKPTELSTHHIITTYHFLPSVVT